MPLGAADFAYDIDRLPGGGGRRPPIWRLVAQRDTAEHEAWLHRQSDNAPWTLVAVVHRSAGEAGWRVDYSDFQNELPRTVRLVSADPRRFDLRVGLTQVELNVPLGPEVFEVKVPATAQPITLEELKRSVPLAAGRTVE